MKRIRGTKRIVALAGLAFLISMGCASSASADTLYAAPDPLDHSAPCPEEHPCRLDVAISAAGVGDTVIVESGDYYLTGTTPFADLPPILNGRTVTGELKSDPPVIHANVAVNAGVILDVKSGALVQDLILKAGSKSGLTYSTGVYVDSGGKIDRILVDFLATNGGSTACGMSGGQVSNTECFIHGPGTGRALDSSTSGGTLTNNVINVTAISMTANGSGISLGTGTSNVVKMFVTNSIARGETSDLRLATNVSTPGGTAQMEVDHSNWVTQSLSGAGVVQLLPDTGNQTGMAVAEPLYRDAALGDYREATGSPTIDAGTLIMAAGDFALGGQPRIGDAATDIGAYEYYPSPTVTTNAATAIGQTSATLGGLISPNGSEAETHFEYGKTSAYGQTINGSLISAVAPATPISATVTGLEPNTTYHFRAVANTPLGGLVNGGDLSFRTAAVAVVVPPAKTAIALTALKIQRKWRLRKGTFVRFHLSGNARVELIFDRKQNGKFRRRGVKFVSAPAGANRIKVKRKLKGGRRLKPGKYRLTAVAVAADGTRSKAKRTFFKLRH